MNNSFSSKAFSTDLLVDVVPTLYISLGGSGAEVLLNLRRKILNNLWGTTDSPQQVNCLTEFPLAQFLHFDLDCGTVTNSQNLASSNEFSNAVQFRSDELIVEPLDLEKYSFNDDALNNYLNIKEWLPLTPHEIRDLGIDPTKGACEIRAISRLYFFDKYRTVSDKIRRKLNELSAALSHESELRRLGLKVNSDTRRIVVVASVTGGTGSGSFLDMGWLATCIADSNPWQVNVDLMLLMPTGFAGPNKDQIQANSYAAVMELEAAMRGNNTYVGEWDKYDTPRLSPRPYSEVYLIDPKNIAHQHSKNMQDVYQMLASSLFDDLGSTGDSGRYKRSVAVNQAQHKNFLHKVLLPTARFSGVNLSYSKSYSSLGYSVLDTKQDLKNEACTNLWAAEMLKTCIGIGLGTNKATIVQRDNFIDEYIGLKPIVFNQFPQFSEKSLQLKFSTENFLDYSIVYDLLSNTNNSLIADAVRKVADRIESIKTNYALKEWSTQVRSAIIELEHDAINDNNPTEYITANKVSERVGELLESRKKIIKNQLYKYLDNIEEGGLDYVLSLIEQIKESIQAPSSGFIAKLLLNTVRYKEINEALKTFEIERLLRALEEIKGYSLFTNNEKQSLVILDALQLELNNVVKFELLSKATEQAVIYLKELLEWLGVQTGKNGQGPVPWSGLVGELLEGRDVISELVKTLDESREKSELDLKKEYVTFIDVPTPDIPADMPNAKQLRYWAADVLQDLGGVGQLFRLLVDSDQKEKILLLFKKVARRHLNDSISLDSELTPSNPLIDALERMTVLDRVDLFKSWLRRAMPWIDLNLNGDFNLKSDQYKCFIYLANAEEFKQKFGDELTACLPAFIGMTSQQIAIVTGGKMGQAVCYTELSGFPLTALQDINLWRSDYLKQSDMKSCLHTHIDTTQFAHVVAPTVIEVNQLADDFKSYLLAVMTRFVVRSQGSGGLAGHYCLSNQQGEVASIGSEKEIRKKGLDSAQREIINKWIEDYLTKADASLLVALSVMASAYNSLTYTCKLIECENGELEESLSLPNIITKEIAIELQEKALKKGLSESEVSQLKKLLSDSSNFNLWTESIIDSNKDANTTEVREIDDSSEPRLKLVINARLLEVGNVSAFFILLENEKMSNSFNADLPPPLPLFSSKIPPPPPISLKGKLPPPFPTSLRRNLPPPIPLESTEAAVQLPPPLMLDVALSQIPPPLNSIPTAVDRLAIIEAIKSASSLKDDGILTQAEFDALKAELLKKLVS